MHIERCSNTMPCPMAIVQPLAPEGCSSKAVQSKTRGALWEDSFIYGNVALHRLVLTSPHDRSSNLLKAQHTNSKFDAGHSQTDERCRTRLTPTNSGS